MPKHKAKVVKTSKTIAYSNALHKDGVNGPTAQKLREKHKNDEVFLRRANTLDELFQMK